MLALSLFAETQTYSGVNVVFKVNKQSVKVESKNWVCRGSEKWVSWHRLVILATYIYVRKQEAVGEGTAKLYGQENL